MKKTTFPKTSVPEFSCFYERGEFSILPGDNITIRLVVTDSKGNFVHVSESITKALSFGKISSVDVGISYRCKEVSNFQSHSPRTHE